MLEDIATQAKVFIGLLGAVFAAFIGVLARNVYHIDGFGWKRTLIDMPFAAVVAMLAGGIGEWMQLPPVVIYGLAGSAGFLGPQWLANFLKEKAEAGKDASDETGAE